MSSLTNFGESLALDLLMGVEPLSSRFIGLFTAAPGESGGGTEMSGSGYVRQSIVFLEASTSGDVTQCVNELAVEFPTATADWTEVTHMAIFDASSGGNMIAYGELASPKTALEGKKIVFAAQTIIVKMS